MISYLYRISRFGKRNRNFHETFTADSCYIPQLVDRKKRLVASNILSFNLMEPNMLLKNKNYPGIQPDRLMTARGFMPLYHEDTVNHCPGCGRTHWHIGRATAECAFCETALPLAATSSQPPEPMFRFRGSATAVLA
jgi:hypothetical protein